MEKNAEAPPTDRREFMREMVKVTIATIIGNVCAIIDQIWQENRKKTMRKPRQRKILSVYEERVQKQQEKDTDTLEFVATYAFCTGIILMVIKEVEQTIQLIKGLKKNGGDGENQ